MNNEHTSLVSIIDGQAFTTSVAIAEGTDNEHASVIKLVRTYQADLEEFGRVGFEIQPFETAGGMQSREIAFLNQEQSTLVMTYMRNSEVVRAFKKRLVKAFYDLARRQFALPSHLETAKMLVAALEREEQLKLELEEALPAVQLVGEITQGGGEFTFSALAKTLFNGSTTEKELRAWAKRNNWLCSTKNEPTAWAIGRGFMRLRTDLKNGMAFQVPVITTKGLETVRHLYRTGELFAKTPRCGIVRLIPGRYAAV